MDSIRTRRPALTAATILIAIVAYLALGAGSAFATHVDCGDVITRDTKLDSDLVNCGLTIGADNVTLDLNGHAIRSTPNCPGGGRGIRNEAGYDNVTIENGAIEGFGYGVHLVGASGNRLRRLTISNGTGFAIKLDNSNGNEIEKNHMSGGCSGGILLENSDHNRVERNTVERAGGGIHAHFGADHNLVSENSVVNTLDAGMGISGNQNVFQKNVLDDTSVGLIVQAGASDNRIDRNVVTGSSGGIRLERFSVGTVVEGNTTSHSFGDGIWVRAPLAGAVIERNHALDNLGNGIRIDEPSTTVTRNTANDNRFLGIAAVESVIDGGGNKAFGNGDPLQCLNVVCK